jgi:hypothetical protein
VVILLYIEYHEYKTKYYKAQEKYDEVLSEKEHLFVKTQPKATQYDKEVVSGGSPSNSFDEYLILKEKKQIDERLEEAKSILDDRERLLKLKEEELRHSKDWLDIIYVYYYIEKLSMRKIAKRIPFSTTEIYRKVEIIRKNIKMEQKGTLNRV